MLKAEPKYITFIDRCVYDFSLFIIIVTVLSIFKAIEKMSGIFLIYLLLLNIGIWLLIYSTARKKNMYYLKSIKILNEEGKVELEIYKFDKLNSTIRLEIKDCKIRIEQNLWAGYRAYNLKIYSNNKIVFSQPETGAWRTDVFVLIARYLSELNATPFYSSSIPLRGTLNKYFQEGENLIITPIERNDENKI